MFSIDQNCHSLWDVIPKLHALARKGLTVRHFIEDVDAAFTAMGAGTNDTDLRLARERYYRSGGADWGAAMFYSEFLGRLPVDVRNWEPLTGMKTAAAARQLGRSADDLYDEFSPSDNWQLIGPSYVGDRRHHRLVGDLSVAETAEPLRRLMQIAEDDMTRCFPSDPSRRRLGEWFARERRCVEELLSRHGDGKLARLYHDWMRLHLDDSVQLDTTSNLLRCGADSPGTELLEVFLKNYDLAAGLYNRAIAESRQPLRPLDTARGELPFFATLEHQGHFVRTAVQLEEDEIHISDRSFKLAAGRALPIQQLLSAGIRCLCGKAIVLVLQVRLGPRGRPLAMPYRGSLYTPAAALLGESLAAHGLLAGPLQPIIRVRFHLLERMSSLDTPIRLPEHLARYFGADEIPAKRLGRDYAPLADEAARRLERLKDAAGRENWQRQSFPRILDEIDALDRRRRELAAADDKSERIRDVWKRIKSLRRELLDRTIRQIADDWQMRDIDYWDSRGALMPWCIALGGESFYNEVVSNAEVPAYLAHRSRWAGRYDELASGLGGDE